MLIDGINSGTIDYVDGSIVADDLASGVIPVAKGKNKLINGNFDVWQRGTTHTDTFGFYTADRWRAYCSPGVTVDRQTFTSGQIDVPGNPTHYLRMGTTSDKRILMQRIEDVRLFSGQNVTLSYYVKAGSAVTVSCAFSQGFGSGGSAGVDNIDVQDITASTSWEKKTITFAIPSVSGKTIGSGSSVTIELTVPIGDAGAVVEFAQMQIEEGSVATDFEQRHIADELALCQRYYEAMTGAGLRFSTAAIVASGGYVACQSPFKVTKRTEPSVSLSNIASAGVNTPNPSYISVYGFGALGLWNASINDAYIRYNWTADAEL